MLLLCMYRPIPIHHTRSTACGTYVSNNFSLGILEEYACMPGRCLLCSIYELSCASDLICGHCVS
ncbi:hypothetical protein BDZ91DRAFT_732849 [Kalaharituber pfeilii]|nr:hypothetical protein BDZ91DRAFT_732849 [Kalaharituber pfeilii]